MDRVRRMVRSLPVIATVVVAIMVSVIVAGAMISLRTSATLSKLHALAADADRVTELGDGLVIGLLDAESNARAYMLSRRPNFLASYTTGRTSVASGLTQLEGATSRFPALTRDMDAIRGLVTARLDQLQSEISTLDTTSEPTIEAMPDTSIGDAVMQEARAQIASLVLHAAQERDRRWSQERARERELRVVVVLAGVSGVLMLGSASLALLGGRHRLLRAQRALQAQSALWQATVENLQDGVAVFDVYGGLVQWNRNLAPLTGFPPELLRQGMSFNRFVRAAAEWQPPVLAGPAPVEAELGAATSQSAVEVRTAGRVLEVWRNGMPGGGHMLTIGDITRRVEAEEIARQAQKMDVLGQLTGGVAHDFNNLLQVVSANLELMSNRVAADQPPLAAWLGSRLVAAMEGVNRGARLTRHLLAFARRQPLTPEPIDAARLLAGLEDMLRRTLGPTVALDQVISDGLWALRADVQQLENAILNLAINARDAMTGNPPDQAHLTIEARNVVLDEAYCAVNQDALPGQYVAISVSDSGCGMTAEQIARAVEPFYTTKPEGEGTGLGLSMVYGFAKQSGGHLKLYSEPGHGTTARLYIPRTMDAASAHEALRGPAAPAGRGESVLLVEDDEAVRIGAALALRGLGYQVEEAATADEGMAMLEQGLRPDLLFTDVMMPGALTARAMAERALELIPGLAVVFTSGYAESSIVHNGHLDTHVQLISKPWRIEELAVRLRQALDLARPTGPDPLDKRDPAGMRILLVEDDALLRLITADMLADLGHDVVQAGDADAALHQSADVDLMITDIGLGETDGLALVAAIRDHRPELPVIVASGQTKPAQGADGLYWLCKPYDRAALQVAMDRVMAGAEPADRPGVHPS